MAARVLWFAAIVCCGSGASFDKGTEAFDTIVVGMGASGTAAASKLARAGLRVLGLEAQNRVGGRVHTVPCRDGVVELGAEWIHGTESNKVYELAMENNVTILPTDPGQEVFFSNGTKADTALFDELLEVLNDGQTHPPKEAKPLGEHLTNKILEDLRLKHPDIIKDQDYVNELLAWADLVIDDNEGTSSWYNVSTDSRYTDLGGNLEMSWHENGYKTLFDILLNKYNNDEGLPTLQIKFKEVIRIEWSLEPNQKVVVTCKDGSSYTADNVIVTVSVGVLKERHLEMFSPSLPQKKVDAIKNIQMGVHDKILLEFSQVWWDSGFKKFQFVWIAEDKKKVKDEDQWTTKIVGASNSMGCSRILTLWLTGDTAKYVETLSTEIIKDKSMELLSKFMGANVAIPDPEKIMVTTWRQNPFTRGAYSYDSIETPEHLTARDDLADPLVDSSGRPRVLFAGEASNPVHYGTVHGALETGYREAERLLP